MRVSWCLRKCRAWHTQKGLKCVTWHAKWPRKWHTIHTPWDHSDYFRAKHKILFFIFQKIVYALIFLNLQDIIISRMQLQGIKLLLSIYPSIHLQYLYRYQLNLCTYYYLNLFWHVVLLFVLITDHHKLCQRPVSAPAFYLYSGTFFVSCGSQPTALMFVCNSQPVHCAWLSTCKQPSPPHTSSPIAGPMFNVCHLMQHESPLLWVINLFITLLM